MTAAPARIIAELRGVAPGPTLIVIGGMHGNEPAGIAAARAVIGTIDRAAICGELIALIGNLRAGAAGRRHLGHDLNRLWTEDHVAAARRLARAGEGGAPELDELVELAAVLDEAIGRARGPVYVLDLHTTSAPGLPFAVVGPTAEHRRFVRAFELPGIIGLEEALPGVLTGYYGRRGCITLAIEGGQHAADATADNLAAIVTLAVEAAGVVHALPGAAVARGLLARVRGELPPLIEVAVRHPVRPEHAFRMEPGFANLQRTAAGTLLAHDRGGEIRAPFDGILLLPLYQPDGDDGFFYGRALDA